MLVIPARRSELPTSESLFAKRLRGNRSETHLERVHDAIAQAGYLRRGNRRVPLLELGGQLLSHLANYFKIAHHCVDRLFVSGKKRLHPIQRCNAESFQWRCGCRRVERLARV